MRTGIPAFRTGVHAKDVAYLIGLSRVEWVASL